jgi:uncharacterized protein with HEPN domain
MKDDLVYLRHILDAIALVERYVSDVSWEDFQESQLVQDGVVRQLGIIGEAARRVSTSVQQAHPEIPWSDMVGMRSILIHDYFEVDEREVWKTVQDDLPTLKERATDVERELREGA